MSELIRIQLRGSEQLVAEFRNAESTFARQITGRLNRLLQQIAGKVIAKLSGEVVKVRTGVLRGSVGIEFAKRSGTNIEGSIYAAGGPAFYGTILERGARPHEIVAVKARALAFQMNGRKVFARSVSHPGITGRWFMKSTRDEIAARVATELGSE